jgi:autotransporter translocation and assembly factor TamB
MSAARRSLQIIAFICTLIVGVASMAAIVTQTTWFKDWLRGFIVRQAGEYVNGQLSIGKLGGNLFYGVELENVDITVNGETVVGVKDVSLDYNAFSFVSGAVVLDDIRLNQPMLRLEKTAEGWNLAHLFKARTPDPDEPKNRRPIEITEIDVTDGTLFIEDGAVGTSGVDAPAKIERLDASLAVKSNEDELTVEIARIFLRASEPALGINAASGVIRRTANEVTLQNVALSTERSSLRVDGTVKNIEGNRQQLDLTASSDKLTLSEFANLVPALAGYALQPALEATVKGPLDRMDVDVKLREATAGDVRADLVVDAAGPERRVAGTVNVEHFNVASVVRNANPSTVQSDITGEARIDLALPTGRAPLSGTYSATASDVQIAGYQARNIVAEGRIDGDVVRVDAGADAYGGRATAAGTVQTRGMVALDLKGRAAGLDMRNLPPQLRMPGVPSNLQFEYTLTGRGREYSGDVRLEESMLAGATIAAGTVGHFAVGSGAPSYAAKGQVTGLDVQQVGRGFGIQAISTDRYRSRVSATFDVKGSGGGRYPLTLDATGTAVDSEIFGATFPMMDFAANIAGGDMKIRSAGQFAGLNPAVVSGNEKLAGDLTGDVNAETTIRGYAGGVTVDTIDVTGQVTLARSSFGDLRIDTAVVDGHYTNREGQLTRLEVTGPDVNVSGQGAIALNETGSSNLTLHADTASLDRIGQIVGQPLKGAAAVDATITGNAPSLKAQGTLKGSGIGHGDSEALSLSSEFTATIPDLTPENATVQAKSVATFLEVRGQTISELTADATYSIKELQFDATAKEGVRELQAAGRAVFHPDHQEIHLSDIALRSEQIQWQTAPGSESTVNYASDRIAVKNVQLISGDQHISADGVFGSPTEPLRVRAENVDVAQLDQLLLGEQRLGGRLTADATITGERTAPRVEGEFALTQGAFRMFTFESLAGKVDYAGQGVKIDVRLQQTPTAWLTAAGYAPLSLLRTSPPETAGVHKEAAPGESIDLQVASSEINLGIVQGFTTYVTNVTGVLQANVHVTGSGEDPHLDGAVVIRGGAFAVPDLGTNYTGLDTQIDLKPDGLTIQEFKILDSRGFPMAVGGTLATHARDIGAVNIAITSESFEVIDNELADLKLNTQLTITGELRKPKVQGSVAVENGTIFVERLLERVTSNPYATEAADPSAAAGPSGGPGVFQALEMDLDLNVPSNLVLRGDDLRPNNTTISVGDINATVGGSVQLRKAPNQDIRVLGEVNTVRGSYTFQGRRFEVLRDGRIRFDGGEEINPLIDIRARRVISGVDTFVRVQGTLRAPELTFSSNPPLDQADILSLIVFNQPVNELGEGQQISLAQRAGAMASGYLTSSLARSIGSALELDEFEIQAAGDDGGGPSLTVGEQVGEKLFVRIRQAFGEAQATEFILDYQLADYLRLQATAAETSGGTQRVRFRRVERGGIDLIFFFSY